MGMIAVDTNIVVRILTQDDVEQFQKSFNLFQENEIFICDTVILEVEWVLRFAYKFSPTQIYQALNKLFGLPNIHLSDSHLIAQVLDWHQSGLDFADASHLAKSQHCSDLYTFDKKFLHKAKGLTECGLRQP